MAGDDAAPVIHQIVFGWTTGSNRNEPGVGPAAWSLDPAGLRPWQERLRARVRMEDLPRFRPPEHSFYYMDWPDGNAAVLRRMRTPDGTFGKEVCHALIGPADLLTVRFALETSRWQSWRHELPYERGPHLLATSIKEIRDECVPHYAYGRLVPDEPDPWLPGLISRVLSWPDHKFSVFTDDEDPIAGLGVFVDIADAMLADLHRPSWTFSTWELADQERDLPRIVFLPAALGDRAFPGRTKVQAGHPAGERRHVAVAEQLVRWALDPTPDLLMRQLRRAGVYDLDQVSLRVERLHQWMQAEHAARPPVEPPAAVEPPPAVQPPPPVQQPPPVEPLPSGEPPPMVERRPVGQIRQGPWTEVPPAPAAAALPASAVFSGGGTRPGPGPGAGTGMGAGVGAGMGAGVDAGPPVSGAPAATPWNRRPAPAPESWQQMPSPGIPAQTLSGRPSPTSFDGGRGPGAVLLDRLRRGDLQRDEVIGTLESMKQTPPAALTEDRRAVRQQLLHGDWTRSLARALHPATNGQLDWTELHWARQVLVSYAVGAELVTGQGRLAPDLDQLARDATESVAVALAQHAISLNAEETLLRALGRRWLREHDLPHGDEIADPPPVLARPVTSPPDRRRNRFDLTGISVPMQVAGVAVATVLVVLALVMIWLLVT